MTTPAVLFPAAQHVTCSWLAANLDGVSVSTEVPNPRPAAFVQVVRIGGPVLNPYVDNAMLSVDVWAATEFAAEELAQLVRSLVRQMRGEVVDGVACYRVEEVGGPANLPDITSAHERFRYTVQVAMRGQPADDGS